MKFLKNSLVTLFLIVGLFLCFHTLSHLEKTNIEQSQQDALKQKFHQNPHVYAWLKVEGTKIDYPVAQHPTDDSYYLSHDLEGNETYYGAIFTELVNTKTFSDSVTIIYGHAMLDDSMFGSLDYFSEQSFFEKQRVMRIETLEYRYEYEIMAAHLYVDDHLFHTFQMDNKEGMLQYVSTLQDRTTAYGGLYRPIETNIDKDRFLILSTCDAVRDGYRYVVTAKLKTVTERTDT